MNLSEIIRHLEVFLSHDAGALAQFVKYALAGGIATVTHILIFHLAGWRLLPCLQARDPFVRLFRLSTVDVDVRRRARNSMYANAVGFILSNAVAYLLNRLFVFEPGRHSMLVEIFLFYAVSAVSVVLGTAIMGWLIRRFGVLTTLAFFANLFSALMINYAMRKFFIFSA